MMCGEAADGALGCGDTGPDRPTPQLIHALISMEVTDVALGTYHAVAITASPRSMYAWGRPGRGRLGLGPITNEKKCITTPQPVSIPDKGVISRVTCGRSSTMVLFTGGQLYACGDNRANKLGLDSRPGVLRTLSHRIHKVDVAWYLTRVHSVGKVRVKTMASGPSFGGAVSTGGNLFMYGKNAVGGLGCGDTTEIKQGTASEVRSILVGRTVRAVACGETFAVAAADDDPELPLVGDVKVKHSKPKTLCAQKIFAWGQGMSERFQKLDTDVDGSIYFPSIVELDSDVRKIRGLSCHDDALAILADSTPNEELRARRKDSTVTCRPVHETQGDGDPHSYVPTATRHSLEDTPVWLREEFEAAAGASFATAQPDVSIPDSAVEVSTVAAGLKANISRAGTSTEFEMSGRERQPTPFQSMVLRRVVSKDAMRVSIDLEQAVLERLSDMVPVHGKRGRIRHSSPVASAVPVVDTPSKSHSQPMQRSRSSQSRKSSAMSVQIMPHVPEASAGDIPLGSDRNEAEEIRAKLLEAKNMADAESKRVRELEHELRVLKNRSPRSKRSSKRPPRKKQGTSVCTIL
mmetsp:Transcript_711/g.2299  ORF Transcript_711/g.2299 Transcript_711/m.2299 type:complete len:577 (+) Transcript_711:2444-4174(+)